MGRGQLQVPAGCPSPGNPNLNASGGAGLGRSGSALSPAPRQSAMGVQGARNPGATGMMPGRPPGGQLPGSGPGPIQRSPQQPGSAGFAQNRSSSPPVAAQMP